MTNRIDLDEAYMQMAEIWAQRSYATRSKVGALLVDPIERRILSDGYNGMPSGFPNEEVEFTNPDGTLSTNPLVLHAESNAILKCAASHGGSKGCTLYCTFSPCPDCAKLIIQAGIKKVVYRNDYRIAEGIPILARAGIEVVKLLPPLTQKPVGPQNEIIDKMFDKPEVKEPEYKIITCPDCGGTGRKLTFIGVFYNRMCGRCDGKGKIKRLIQ